ncbi:hypothetical protein QG516_22565 [Pedobacter gandavensis]|uniref:hypothetical protein n=1 Tax=Pedobacter TaxID=84567 RepID=UPI001C994384|nr:MULTISPECIES: hypothetical protein [Pedobacter]WGQ09302.1 hypothetical protein QG516_22565 [Pedobacter gandavensis]
MKRVFFFMMALLCCVLSAKSMYISSLWKKCQEKGGCRHTQYARFPRYSGQIVQLKVKLQHQQVVFTANGND